MKSINNIVWSLTSPIIRRLITTQRTENYSKPLQLSPLFKKKEEFHWKKRDLRRVTIYSVHSHCAGAFYVGFVDRYDLGITVPTITRISMTSGNNRMDSSEVCKQEEIIAIGYSEAEEGPRRCIVSADGGYWRPAKAVAMHWRTSINFAPQTDRCVFRCVLNCLATVFSRPSQPQRTHEMRGDADINQCIYR